MFPRGRLSPPSPPPPIMLPSIKLDIGRPSFRSRFPSLAACRYNGLSLSLSNACDAIRSMSCKRNGGLGEASQYIVVDDELLLLTELMGNLALKGKSQRDITDKVLCGCACSGRPGLHSNTRVSKCCIACAKDITHLLDRSLLYSSCILVSFAVV